MEIQLDLFPCTNPKHMEMCSPPWGPSPVALVAEETPAPTEETEADVHFRQLTLDMLYANRHFDSFQERAEYLLTKYRIIPR